MIDFIQSFLTSILQINKRHEYSPFISCLEAILCILRIDKNCQDYEIGFIAIM